MARTHRLTSHKAQKAPKTKLIRAKHHGNITKRLHGRKRAAAIHHQSGQRRPPIHHRTHTPGAHRHVAGHKARKPTHPAIVRRHRKPLTAAQRAHLSAALRGKHHTHHGVVRHAAGHHKLSAATKAKIAAKLRGKHHKGHPMSAAARAKLSAKLRGKHHPGRKGIHHKGHPMSAAARAKLSAKLRGRKHPHRGVRGHRARHSTRRKRR